MDERRPPIEFVVGPATCQGCHQVVIYVRHGEQAGWLHANGLLACLGVRVVPKDTFSSKREYNRLWMRQRRARKAMTGVVGSPP